MDLIKKFVHHNYLVVDNIHKQTFTSAVVKDTTEWNTVKI